MTLPDIELPDDVEALKAMVLAMAERAARVEALEKQVDDLEARNADADERIERLTQILKAFDRARFGRRSEKLESRLRSRKAATTRMANAHSDSARALRRILSALRS